MQRVNSGVQSRIRAILAVAMPHPMVMKMSSRPSLPPFRWNLDKRRTPRSTVVATWTVIVYAGIHVRLSCEKDIESILPVQLLVCIIPSRTLSIWRLPNHIWDSIRKFYPRYAVSYKSEFVAQRVGLIRLSDCLVNFTTALRYSLLYLQTRRKDSPPQ
jgi:hypothetical protein